MNLLTEGIRNLTLSRVSRPHPAHYRASGTLFSRAMALLHRWDERARQRQHLSELPPQLLDDIGVSAAAAAREAAKPFWQA